MTKTLTDKLKQGARSAIAGASLAAIALGIGSGCSSTRYPVVRIGKTDYSDFGDGYLFHSKTTTEKKKGEQTIKTKKEYLLLTPAIDKNHQRGGDPIIDRVYLNPNEIYARLNEEGLEKVAEATEKGKEVELDENDFRFSPWEYVTIGNKEYVYFRTDLNNVEGVDPYNSSTPRKLSVNEDMKKGEYSLILPKRNLRVIYNPSENNFSVKYPNGGRVIIETEEPRLKSTDVIRAEALSPEKEEEK